MRISKYLSFVLLLAACNTGQQDKDTVGGTNNERVVVHTDTVYLTRNSGITPANSYSDLFLDTSIVEQFLQTKNLSADDQARFKSFYNYRNFQFAWFTSLGFTEQAKGFWNLQDKFGTNVDKAMRNAMDTLLNNDTLVISRYDTAIQKMELALTNAYLQFYKTNRDKTQFAAISPEMLIPVKKESALVLADTLLAQRIDTAANNTSPQYVLLKQKLQLYNSVAKSGGWGVAIPSSKQIKKGTSSPNITLIKRRLQKSGELSGTDSSRVFNDTLFTAIQSYQSRNGMRPTGIITDTLIRSLNVPVEKRIRQIIINLNRMQWMPGKQEGNYLTVNIPDFLLTAYENNSKAFDMPVAVGKEGTNTTIFSGDLNQIVFSPYWNIPVSIVRREILPKMKADPTYLKSKRMEIVGKNDSLPTIRQLPGKDNALGKVKFLFPNRYDIYFHDTDAKEIFNKDKRAVSHGCIRLADAEKLSIYLLRNNKAWTPEKVTSAMNSGKEQYVKLSPSIPVAITYYTAWVDETGQLNFRDDIYLNDSKVEQMMFANTAPTIAPVVKDSSAKNKR
jgi:murein L,D-transpeptidase YcbB/YkuD